MGLLMGWPNTNTAGVVNVAGVAYSGSGERIAAVEVSTDCGVTWREASGKL